MDAMAMTVTDRRKLAGARRRRPTRPEVLEFFADGDGRHGPENGPPPSEIRLETTYPNGQVVNWFDDAWWLETLKRWKDRRLAIHLMPTPDALLHPIVFHEIEMVRRMETPWSVVGYCYLSDISHPMLISRIAASPYDEIRIIDAMRPETTEYDVRPGKFPLLDLMERIKAVQKQERAAKPILTRAPDTEY